MEKKLYLFISNESEVGINIWKTATEKRKTINCNNHIKWKYLNVILIHANLQRKVYFVGEGVPTHLKVGKFLEISLLNYPTVVGL